MTTTFIELTMAQTGTRILISPEHYSLLEPPTITGPKTINSDQGSRYTSIAPVSSPNIIIPIKEPYATAKDLFTGRLKQ